jgi:hypothetical protein
MAWAPHAGYRQLSVTGPAQAELAAVHDNASYGTIYLQPAFASVRNPDLDRVSGMALHAAHDGSGADPNVLSLVRRINHWRLDLSFRRSKARMLSISIFSESANANSHLPTSGPTNSWPDCCYGNWSLGMTWSFWSHVSFLAALGPHGRTMGVV